MTLLTLRDISVSYGGPAVLHRINLRIDEGERLCLIGRNGEGKSTLMRLIAGEINADSGEFVRQPGLRVARLAQEVPEHLPGTVREVVGQGLGEMMALLEEHHAISVRLADQWDDTENMAKLSQIEHELERIDGWRAQQRIDTILARLDLPADQNFDELSGGMKRRVLLGRALVSEPDLLLLDEPTNHLDIASIAWLEEFLLTCGLTMLFVTHDRALLQKLATRIIDLDRGELTSWPGDYANYLRRKEETLHAERAANQRFDRKLAQEEIWIRQGIKARRTRNEGRVRVLVEMRRDRQERRETLGRVKMEIKEAEISGRLVAQAKNISMSYDGKKVLDGFSTTILRGDKVGIIGPNGCGKTTLLRILLGELAPESGSVRLGVNLQPAYFDQHRRQLNDNDTVAASVGDGKDMIPVGDKTRHVIGYLQDFLFTPDRARSPVSVLSGGERNRLLLAKLFAKPANILVLDEPTNDLDVETLELLEELLVDFSGTVLLVSHDRAFLNNVVTSTIVFEDDGVVREYAGGYDDWLMQRPATDLEKSKELKEKKEKKDATPVRQDTPRKLSFKEEKELAGLPGTIENLEQEQSDLMSAMAEPAFFRGPADEVTACAARLAAIEAELAAAYERWQELEEAQRLYQEFKGK